MRSPGLHARSRGEADAPSSRVAMSFASVGVPGAPAPALGSGEEEVRGDETAPEETDWDGILARLAETHDRLMIATGAAGAAGAAAGEAGVVGVNGDLACSSCTRESLGRWSCQLYLRCAPV